MVSAIYIALHNFELCLWMFNVKFMYTPLQYSSRTVTVDLCFTACSVKRTPDVTDLPDLYLAASTYVTNLLLQCHVRIPEIHDCYMS